jgi:hypothetical protein
MKRYLLLFSLLILSSGLGAKKLYVNSLQIVPVEQPQYGAKKLDITIPRGTAVEQIEIKDSWSRVQYDKKEGWVPNIVLTEQKPGNKVSPLTETNVDISKDARKRASGYTSAAAARGLTGSGRKRVNSTQAPDYEALRKMENGKAKEKEAVEFVNKKEDKKEDK